jgi:hypothetical protein
VIREFPLSDRWQPVFATNDVANNEPAVFERIERAVNCALTEVKRFLSVPHRKGDATVVATVVSGRDLDVERSCGNRQTLPSGRSQEFMSEPNEGSVIRLRPESDNFRR